MAGSGVILAACIVHHGRFGSVVHSALYVDRGRGVAVPFQMKDTCEHQWFAAQRQPSQQLHDGFGVSLRWTYCVPDQPHLHIGKNGGGRVVAGAWRRVHGGDA